MKPRLHFTAGSAARGALVQLTGAVAIVTLLSGGCGDDGVTIKTTCITERPCPRGTGGTTARGAGGSQNTSGGVGQVGEPEEAGAGGKPGSVETGGAAAMAGAGASGHHAGAGGLGGESGGSAGEAGIGGEQGGVGGGAGATARGGGGAGGKSAGGGVGGGGAPGRGGSGGAATGGTSTGGTSTGGQSARCGDKIVQAGEECDDGNEAFGDGCYRCQNTAACEACVRADESVTSKCGSWDPGKTFWDAISDFCLSTANPERGGAQAIAGPAQGRPRAELCSAALNCALKNQCSVRNDYIDLLTRCWCGRDDGTLGGCEATSASGPCSAEIEAAGEAPSRSGLSAWLASYSTDVTTGHPIGWVGIALNCMSDPSLCGPQCGFLFDRPGTGEAGSGGSDARGAGGGSHIGGSVSSGGTATTGGTRSTGGASNSGGTGGASNSSGTGGASTSGSGGTAGSAGRAGG